MSGGETFDEGAPLCICCEDAPATRADLSLGGDVCGFCKALLDAADVSLQRVAGLGGWQNIPRGGVAR